MEWLLVVAQMCHVGKGTSNYELAEGQQQRCQRQLIDCLVASDWTSLKGSHISVPNRALTECVLKRAKGELK